MPTVRSLQLSRSADAARQTYFHRDRRSKHWRRESKFAEKLPPPPKSNMPSPVHLIQCLQHAAPDSFARGSNCNNRIGFLAGCGSRKPKQTIVQRIFDSPLLTARGRVEPCHLLPIVGSRHE